MTSAMTQELHGIRVLLLAAEGPKLRTARDATDVMSEAFSQSASLIAIPISRLDDDFLRLRTGVAGEIVPKLIGYVMKAAFLGDISQHVANSDSFRDFVREANRATSGSSPISRNSASASPGHNSAPPPRRQDHDSRQGTNFSRAVSDATLERL